MMPPARAGKSNYIHATAVRIGEAGLLIRGPSRAGKSSLALALLAEAARLSLYGRLIGDDRIAIERSGDSLLLRGHPAILGKIEQRGEGILDMAWEPSGVADYVIDLSVEKFDADFEAGTVWLENLQLRLFKLPPGTSAMERAKLVMRLLQAADSSSTLLK